MLTFVTAYLLIWFAVSAYLVRLGSQQRRLRRAIEALEKQLKSKPSQKRAA
jgi:CcmD family protein